MSGSKQTDQKNISSAMLGITKSNSFRSSTESKAWNFSASTSVKHSSLSTRDYRLREGGLADQFRLARYRCLRKRPRNRHLPSCNWYRVNPLYHFERNQFHAFLQSMVAVLGFCFCCCSLRYFRQLLIYMLIFFLNSVLSKTSSYQCAVNSENSVYFFNAKHFKSDIQNLVNTNSSGWNNHTNC